MFTGIVQSVGRIVRLEHRSGDVRIVIRAAGFGRADVAPGDSVAVSGACLTAVDLADDGFAADVSLETLSLTTLGRLQSGDPVNLEKALRVGDRLGGHLVSGHVDGIGTVESVRDDGRSQRWRFRVPASLARYLATKGSVTIDGTSLTINEVDGNRFGVNLVPHTVANTTFATRKVGQGVNIEVDVMARYVERMLAPDEPESAAIDLSSLMRSPRT